MKKHAYLVLLFFNYCFVNSQKVENNLEQPSSDLQEIVIGASKTRQRIDKTVYSFNEQEQKSARNAKDLLTAIPTLVLDPMTNTIQSIKGGKTLFLVNGVESNDTQISAIVVDNVLRVEYYDIAPTRWADKADQVVNVIVRKPQNGVVFGLDAIGSFQTGFVNGSAYSNLTRGNNNFSINYDINYRDYSDRQTANTTKYTIEDTTYDYTQSAKSKFGYTTQDLTLKYTNTKDHTFQVEFNAFGNKSFDYKNGTSLYHKNSIEQNHIVKEKQNEKYFIPSLDLYYSREVTSKGTLILNAVGTYYTTNSNSLDKQSLVTDSTLEDIYNYTTDLKTTQKGISGEVAYENRFENSQLNVGYRISVDHVGYNLSNLEGDFNYTTNFLNQYIYSEYFGQYKNWMYRVGVSLNNIKNSSPQNVQNSWVFTPKLILGYQISDSQSIRLSSSYAPRALSSDQISSNVIQLDPNIIKTGNPFLKVQRNFSNSLSYRWSSKYFDLNALVSFSHINDYVNSRYVLDGQKIALTYVNDNYYQRSSFNLYGAVKPFGTQLLVLQLNVYPTFEKVRRAQGVEITNNYIGNNFTVSSSFSDFVLSYSFNSPVYSLSGEFLNTNENMSNFYARYKLNNWSFTTGVLFIGGPAEYKNKTVPSSLVYQKGVSKIYDNQNMVIFGVSYNLSKGKKTSVERSIRNYNKGAVTF